MPNSLLNQLRSVYMQFNSKTLSQLPEIYAEDIQFRDPFHAINGLSGLTIYFESMMKDLIECRFEFHHSVELPSEAVLFWTMHYSHKKIAGGQLLEISGSSHLKFNDKVFFHRDYFDAGAMLYEHLPLVGGIIGFIKRRMSK